jgi:Fe2+ or Zn2+ uptake regulation protein
MSFFGIKFNQLGKTANSANDNDASHLLNAQVRLTCIVCGRTEELSGHMDQSVAEQIQSDTGFNAEIVKVQAGGTCRSCSQRNN